MMILRVRFKMFLESGDPLGQERNLNFGGTGIGIAPFVDSNDFRFFCCRDQFGWLLLVLLVLFSLHAPGLARAGGGRLDAICHQIGYVRKLAVFRSFFRVAGV